MDGKMGKSMVQEMRFFDDGSVVARSGSAWIIWEPRGGIEYWSPAEDPEGDFWDECDAASFVATKDQRSQYPQDEVNFACS